MASLPKLFLYFFILHRYWLMAYDFKYMLVKHAFYLMFAHSADVVPLYLLTRMIQAVGQTKADV